MMKTIGWMIALVLLTSCGEAQQENKDSSSKESTQGNSEAIAQKLSVSEFKSKLEEKENAQVIDVRTPEELKQGYVKGAVNYNFYDKDFEENLSTLDKSQPVFVYCAAGGRSGEAYEMLRKKGFEEVYDMKGGMNAWYAAGYPTKN